MKVELLKIGKKNHLAKFNTFLSYIRAEMPQVNKTHSHGRQRFTWSVSWMLITRRCKGRDIGSHDIDIA